MKAEEFLKGGKFTTITADDFLGNSSFKVLDQETIKQKGETGLKGFATGIAKGEVSTVKGIAGLGEKIASQTAGRVVNLIQGRGFKPTPVQDSFGQLVGGDENVRKLTEPVGTAEKVGFTGEKIAEFAVPGSKVTAATKGASLVGKIAPRAITSGTVATAQQGEVGKDALIAAGTEAALPVVGKVLTPVKNIVSRLTKSLASGLSGVSSKAIESMVAEPGVAKTIAKNVDLGKQSEVLTKNAETIINGVSKVRQQARTAFGEGLEKLGAQDIKPAVFRNSVKSSLDKFGSVVKNGVRKLENVEFSDPKNVKTASSLINKLSTTNLDGLSLRRLSDEIESKAYKIATTDERLSFNAFIRELSGSVRKAINESTDKLAEINKAYSTDLQLTEAVEGILGKVKFKNLNEVRKVSQQLENLFSKKGLSPEIIDDFLTRVGVKPSEFRASEAVRQISDVGAVKNTEGLTLSELIRGVTSAVITPKTVRDVSIATGLAEETVVPILERLAPTARASFIQLLMESNNE